ncbi:exosortase system-associated protein, TIGR04073 family [Lentisphaerota bacterium ZTH]|nr:exosortase system-associated protein, TIGR04073 family [Lentisphaerota bacterium]WET06199.1 exosortase system-associated protein, TIGR04073 family [Lentisphaerota bacterium ZTH]
MKYFRKTLILLIILFSIFAVFNCQAADTDSSSGPLEKLGRGVANIAFGPLELLIRPWDVAQDKGNVAALTYGVLKGVAFTIARAVVGTIDIITFPMPLPGCTDDPKDVGWGYGPMIRPAWVVDMDHNAYNFFYKDETLAETY